VIRKRIISPYSHRANHYQLHTDNAYHLYSPLLGPHGSLSFPHPEGGGGERETIQKQALKLHSKVIVVRKHAQTLGRPLSWTLHTKMYIHEHPGGTEMPT